jgi:hypothetical protein
MTHIPDSTNFPSIITALALMFTSTSAFAQYPDPEVQSMRDMLKPSAECRGQQTAACKAQARRACRMEIDGTSVPCELVWYIEFKDGRHAVQFNKGTGKQPTLSFSGIEGDADTIKVDTVMLRNGDRSVAMDESEATGLCHISKAAMACQARMRDGRVVAASIFVGGAR